MSLSLEELKKNDLVGDVLRLKRDPEMRKELKLQLSEIMDEINLLDDLKVSHGE